MRMQEAFLQDENTTQNGLCDAKIFKLLHVGSCYAGVCVQRLTLGHWD